VNFLKGSLSPELKAIETLVIKGKYLLALKQLDLYLEKDDISVEDYINSKILKSRIYYFIQPYSEAIENGHEALQKSKEINNNYLIFDSAFRLLTTYVITGNIDEAFEYQDILRKTLILIEDKNDVEYLRRKAISLRTHAYREGFDSILEDLNQGLEIAEQIGDETEMGWQLFYLGLLHSLFDKKSEALEFYKRSLTIANRTDDIELKMGSECNTADIYLLRGELDNAYQHFARGLTLAEEMNSPFVIGVLLYSTAIYYWHKGDIETTLQYYERSKASLEKAKNTKHWHYSEVLYLLAMVSLEKGNLEKALELRDKLETIKNQQKEIHQSHRLFRLVKAFIIKYKLTQGIEHDLDKRLEAEQIFRELSLAKFAFADINKTALFHLCDLYVQEFHNSKDQSIFDKLKQTVHRFRKKAEEQESSILLAEVYLFESQLALLENNTKEAKVLMNKAQMIADEKGIHKLGTLISNAHDELIDQLDFWDSTTHQLPDIIDRMELTCLEELLEKFVKNKISYEDIILETEKPSTFLMIDQIGSILFTENFESLDLTEMMMNKLTETINKIETSQEESERFIERTKVDGYNVIFQEIDGFKLCYAFKGKSYSAISKFRILLNEFHNSTDIWEALKTKIQNEQSFDLNERIHLSNYLQTIFTK
jgi:tetratricopeptide (TPR) repeat protein